MLRLFALSVCLLASHAWAAAEPPEQPDPRRDPMRGLDPSMVEGSGPIPCMKPWNYYALEATEAQVLALAEVSPPAAWMVAISRVGGPGLPAPLEVNDSV